jgi:hypothetical protein
VRILLLMACVLGSLPAFAETDPGSGSIDNGSSAFERLDRNRDGWISRREASVDGEIEKRFARFDANKDKLLSLEEYQRARQDQQLQFLADMAVTSKVKSALLLERGIQSTAISVDTSDGLVQLSGVQPRPDQIALAGRTAAKVSGVKTVQNDLRVK